MIEDTIITYLKGFTDLTERVGDKFFLLRAPRMHFDSSGREMDMRPPYIVISRVGGDTGQQLGGETGAAQAILQFTAWASDPNGPKEADTVFELIRDKLSGYRGTVGGVLISEATLLGEPSTYAEEPEDDSDDWFCAVTGDFQITHSRPVPTHA